MRKYLLMAAVAAAVAGVSGNAMAETKVKVGGRIMVDSEFGRGINGSSGFKTSSAEEVDYDTQLERARLKMSGDLTPDWGFKIEYDFAKGGAAAKDVLIAYKGFKPASILVGHFKEPFSIEEMESSNYMPFIDRTVVHSQFVPSRNVGTALHMGGSNYSATAGVFGKGPGFAGQDGKYSVAGRFTFAPIATATTALHLGAAVNYIDVHSSALYTSTGGITTGNKDNKEPAGYHVGNPNFVDLDKSTLGGLEAAAVFGPVFLQGEYIKAFNTYLTPGRDSDPSGWYVETSFFPTGESRNYVASKGAFGKTKTKGNAIELAARYGVLKLDQAGQDDVKQTTFGVNWYATSNMRLMADYEMINYGNNANRGIQSGAPVAESKDNYFMARANIFW